MSPQQVQTNSPAVKYIDILLYLFLGLAVITSQFSIATSSIGVGGLVILTALKIVLDKSIKFDYMPAVYLAGGFVLIQIIAALFSADKSHAFDQLYRKTPIFITFFSAIIIFNDTKSLQRFLAAFFIFTALISCIEIILFYINYQPQQLSEYRLDFFGYPITNGEIKMMILLILIPLIASKSEFILNKVILILLSLPLLFTFYLTNARNAVLGVVLGLAVFGALKNRYFLAAMIIIIGVFLLFAPLPLKERIMSIADVNHPSNHTRFIMWDTGLKMIKDHPLIGIGDVEIKKAYEQYKKPEFHGEGAHMHNNIVQIAVTSGLMGLSVWLMWMLYLFFRQIKFYFSTKKNELLNTLALSSLCSMIAFQVSGLTEWNFGDAEFAVVMWFNLALGFIAYKLISISSTNEA